MLRGFGLVATAVHSLLFVFPPEERDDLITRVYEITQTSLQEEGKIWASQNTRKRYLIFEDIK